MEYKIVEQMLPENFDVVLRPLLEAHWDELAKNKKLMVLNPDVDKYLFLNKAGVLFCLFAYHGSELVGYSVTIVQNLLHYSDVKVACNDVIFIDKAHRGTSVGVDLIKATEQVAKDKGAQVMLWHAKENTALNHILPNMGCKVHEVVYSKEL